MTNGQIISINGYDVIRLHVTSSTYTYSYFTNNGMLIILGVGGYGVSKSFCDDIAKNFHLDAKYSIMSILRSMKDMFDEAEQMQRQVNKMRLEMLN